MNECPQNCVVRKQFFPVLPTTMLKQNSQARNPIKPFGYTIWGAHHGDKVWNASLTSLTEPRIEPQCAKGVYCDACCCCNWNSWNRFPTRWLKFCTFSRHVIIHFSSFGSSNLLDGGNFTHSQKHFSTVSFICLYIDAEELVRKMNMKEDTTLTLTLTLTLDIFTPEGLTDLCLNSIHEGF